MINNEVRKQFFKAYETLKKAQVVETNQVKLDPNITWGSEVKNVNFNSGTGVATSSGAIFDITAEKNPNALVIKSDVGVLKNDGSNGEYVVEDIIDAIKGTKTGKRGYKGRKYVAKKISNYAPYTSAGVETRDIEDISTGITTMDEFCDLMESEIGLQWLEGYLPLIVRMFEEAPLGGSETQHYFLVRGIGLDQMMGDWINGTEKYQVVWDLVEQRNQPNNPMEFFTDSTIAINSITERLVKA